MRINFDVNGYGDPPQPPFPTAAFPGSPEKVKIMRQRMSAGKLLYHPEDRARTGEHVTAAELIMEILASRGRNGAVARGEERPSILVSEEMSDDDE